MFGKRVLQTGVGWADYVGSVAVAAHELLLCRWIVNRDQVTGAGVDPIAKISLPFRKRGYRDCGPGEGTPDPEGFKVGKEESAVIPVFPERQFQRTAEISSKIVLDVLCFSLAPHWVALNEEFRLNS